MTKNITIVGCHSRVGGNLDTCFRRYDTKFVLPNSIGFTINSVVNNGKWYYIEFRLIIKASSSNFFCCSLCMIGEPTAGEADSFLPTYTN